MTNAKETVSSPTNRVAVPEPDLTPDQMVARARAFIPMLREQQEESEARGYYGEKAHEAFKRAGLYRVIQPRMFGGYEFDFSTFLRVIIEISRGDPAAGWCYALASSHALVVGAHFPEDVQAEIFGSDGDFRAPFRALPAGEFQRVEGGYVVTGKWSYASGAPVATHFIGAGMLFDTGPRPRMINIIVPRADFTVLDDWGHGRSLGMNGSGSNTVELKSVFVPDRHVISHEFLLTTANLPDGTHGSRLHGNPMYLGIVGGSLHSTFCGIYVGAARAALDEYEETAKKMSPRGRPHLKQIDDVDVQGPFGEALTLTACAEELTLRIADLYMEQCARWAKTGEAIATEDTMRLWAMSRRTTLMACKAIEILFQTSPIFAASRGHRMQRYLREAQMYRIHPSTQPWVDEAHACSHWQIPIEKLGQWKRD